MDARIGFEVETAFQLTRTGAHPGERMVDAEEWHGIAKQLGLTNRERQVVALLFQGNTREACARKLIIKPRTVGQYVEQIYEKLNIQDRVELVLLIVECRDRHRAQTALHEEKPDL